MRYEDILNYIKGSDLTIIELGFCDGETTREISNYFKGRISKFIAYEPVLSLCAQVKNSGLLPKVKLCWGAVGKENGEVPLYISSGTSPINQQNFYASSSIKKPKNASTIFTGMEFTEARTPVITLDTVYHENILTTIDFIHSDIQGAEEDMILGGAEALKNTKYLYTEVSEGGDYYEGEISAERILELLPEWELVLRHENNILIRNTKFK